MQSLTIKATQLKIKRATEQGIRKAARSLAKSLPEMIRQRTRSGRGLLGTLAGLSSGYVEKRKKSKRLSKETSPTKSNLTATGQMLNALKGIASGSIVTVFVADKARTRELGGGDSTKTNKEVARYADETGRPFLGITPQEEANARKEATKIIADEIKRVLGG